MFRPVALALMAPALVAAAPSPEARFQKLLQEHWEWNLRTHPTLATSVGDRRWNDRLGEASAAALRAELAQERRFLARAKAIPERALPEAAKLDRALFIRSLEEDLEGARFKPWEMNLNQFGGLHTSFPQLANLHPFETVKDYEDYAKRLRAFGRPVDDTIANLRQGLKDGLVPPRILLVKVEAQLKALSEGEGARAPFLEPLKRMPAAFADADKARLTKAFESALDEVVTPAYQRLLTFIRKEYLPKGRETVGAWALPEGPARYRFAVKQRTTTPLAPEAIHEIGLKEVARIEGEMRAIAASQGFQDLDAYRKHLHEDPANHPKEGAEILDRYRAVLDAFRPELPKLFGRLPKAPFAVAEVEAYRAAGAAGASYQTGTPDGKRPGRIMVNTYKAPERTMHEVEAVAYHEGLPGHHMQLSIAQEMEGLPEFRKHYSSTAFIEGWGLYAERLPKELGYYKDPASDFGRLDSEIFRAVRLVVDTGMHAKKWSRDQAVAYMKAHTSFSDVQVQTEIDRYIAWPGQALAYKMGQLKILELREKAKAALGPKFDLRGFHDLVLEGGALPLDVLGQRVDGWIASRK